MRGREHARAPTPRAWVLLQVCAPPGPSAFWTLRDRTSWSSPWECVCGDARWFGFHHERDFPEWEEMLSLTVWIPVH